MTRRMNEVERALERAGRENPLLGLPSDVDGTPCDAFDARAVVDAVAAAYRTQERRVAGSLAVLGYSARLLGPSIALLLRDGLLLDVRPANLRYSYTPERGMRLTLPAPAARSADPAALVREWTAMVVDAHLAPVLAAVRDEASVAAGLLWGNVASGLAGTVRAMARHRPADDCFEVGRALLGQGPLRGTGLFERDRLRFTRRSCCLYYRLPGAGLCGDCVLAPGARDRLRDDAGH